MDKKVLEVAVREFLKENRRSEDMSFSIPGNPTEFVTIRFEKRYLQIATEHEKFEARANTISALPAGSTCSRCGGTGRA